MLKGGATKFDCMSEEVPAEIQAYQSLPSLEIDGENNCVLCDNPNDTGVSRPYPAHADCLSVIMDISREELEVLHFPQMAEEKHLPVFERVYDVLSNGGPSQAQLEEISTRLRESES